MENLELTDIATIIGIIAATIPILGLFIKGMKSLQNSKNSKLKRARENITLARELAENGILEKDSSEYIEREAFYQFYKINTDSEMRSALTDFYERNKRKISLRDLQRVYYKMELKDGQLEIELGRWDRWSNYTFTILGSIDIALSVFILLGAAILSVIEPFSCLKEFGQGLFLLFAGIVIIFFDFDYFSSKRIWKAIREEQAAKEADIEALQQQ